jgi:translation initiation factor IF-2
MVAGGTYAKVRNLESTTNQPLKEATPSTPVVITGFKELPQFGDEFIIVKDEKTARHQAQSVEQTRRRDSSKQDIGSGELIRMINRTNQITELPVIVKADVQGSLTSVIDSIKSLDSDEVVVQVVSSGVGSVTESDTHLAHTANAIIYGFNTQIPTSIKRLASRDKVSIRLYSVIYELIDDVKEELSKLLSPEIVETDTGRLVVKLTVPALARIYRGKELLAEAEVTNLKRGPQDTKEVFEGEMCGMNIATTSKVDVQEGDEVQLFTREAVTRHL